VVGLDKEVADEAGQRRRAFQMGVVAGNVHAGCGRRASI
jgi:hypothetical protein